MAESKKVRIPLIYYVPFIVLYLVYGQRPYDTPLVGGLFSTPTPTLSNTYTPTVTSTPFITQTPTLFAGAPPASVLTSTSTPTSAYQSNGLPSGFPFITDRGDFYKSVHRVLFSYYYPDLGGVNCHEDNWKNGSCANVTASQVVGWREYLGRGIAIHSDMYDEIPYGSQVYVYSPVEIAGTYTVVDLCCGCLNNNGYYFDFLFDRMPDGLNWSYNVDFVVTRYGWDVQLVNLPAPNCGQYVSVPTATATVTQQLQFTQTPLPTYTALPTYTPFPTNTLVPTETPIP